MVVGVRLAEPPVGGPSTDASTRCNTGGEGLLPSDLRLDWAKEGQQRQYHRVWAFGVFVS